MSTDGRALVTAVDGQIQLTVAGLGRLEMPPESAVTLAAWLLDAAREVDPKVPGVVLWPPRIDWSSND